jgi:hypothetical protein
MRIDIPDISALIGLTDAELNVVAGGISAQPQPVIQQLEPNPSPWLQLEPLLSARLLGPLER